MKAETHEHSQQDRPAQKVESGVNNTAADLVSSHSLTDSKSTTEVMIAVHCTMESNISMAIAWSVFASSNSPR